MAKETTMLDRIAEWTKYVWFASTLIIVAIGWLHKFDVMGLKAQWNWDKETNDLVVLTVLAAMSGGLWGYVHRFKKDQKETLSSVSNAFENASTNQPFLELYYTMPRELTKSVISYGEQRRALRQAMESSDELVRNVLREHSDDYERRISALSNGQIDIPLQQSPSVNAKIISTFGERMDAVSRDNLDFWERETGHSYLDQCTTALGKGGTPDLSRIFILQRDALHQDQRIANILNTHLNLNIGFAIVIEDSLSPLKRNHEIPDEV